MPEALHKSGRPLGEGCIFEARELLPPGLLSRLAAYKQNVARSYANIPSENIARYLPQERFFISTKIDGEQWFLHKNGHGSLLDPQGNSRSPLFSFLRFLHRLHAQPRGTAADRTARRGHTEQNTGDSVGLEGCKDRTGMEADGRSG